MQQSSGPRVGESSTRTAQRPADVAEVLDEHAIVQRERRDRHGAHGDVLKVRLVPLFAQVTHAVVNESRDGRVPRETKDAREGWRRDVRRRQHVPWVPRAVLFRDALFSLCDVRGDRVAKGGFGIGRREPVKKPVEFAPHVRLQRILSLVVEGPRGFVHRHLRQDLVHVVVFRRQVGG